MIKPHKFTPKRQSESAFTIVELLIVIVIIAILAAITVVAYNGIQNRARASAASSALSQAVKKLELYKVDTSAYPTSANLSSAGITNSNDTTYQYTSDGTTYCLTATNVTVSYYLNSTTTPSPTAGGCPGHGVGGNSPITNLVADPRTTNLDYWATYGGNTGTSAVALSIQSVSWSSSGKAARATALTGATSTNAEVGSRGNLFTAPASGTVTFSMYVRASSTRTGAYLRIRSTLGDVTSSPTSVGTTPTRLSVTATSLTSGLPFSVAYKESGGASFNSGDYVEASQVMITEGATLYNYADGSSANWIWNGTANASTSTGPAL